MQMCLVFWLLLYGLFLKVIFTPSVIVRKERQGKASYGRAVISMRFQVVILRLFFLTDFSSSSSFWVNELLCHCAKCVVITSLLE